MDLRGQARRFVIRNRALSQCGCSLLIHNSKIFKEEFKTPVCKSITNGQKKGFEDRTLSPNVAAYSHSKWKMIPSLASNLTSDKYIVSRRRKIERVSDFAIRYVLNAKFEN